MIKKSLLTVILFMLTLTVCKSNELFLYSYHGTPEFTEVVNNELINLEIKPGKTFNVKNGLSIDTATNSIYTIYEFPQKVAVAQMQNTQTYFNEFDIEYKNSFELPEVISVKESFLTFSFTGEIYIKSQSDQSLTISTPLANIVLNDATIFIKSEKRQTHVYVINGKVNVLDTKSSKKKKELNKNDYLVVTPKPINNGKGMQNTTPGNLFSMRDVEDEDMSSYLEFDKILTDCINNTLFINYNTNIFGVKIK